MILTTLVALMAQTSGGEWLRVNQHDGQSVTGTKISSWSSFGDLNKPAAPSIEQRVEFSQLQVPLINQEFASLGLGLSYPSHQQEVNADTTVFFRKDAKPTAIDAPIAYRPHLDFEAEVSLLMHRQEKTLFGYLVHNDLTDRGIQVANFDADNPAPGFSKSKSFAGANAHGFLMAVGGAELWNELQVELFVNGIKVQDVRPRENVLTPADIHRIVFQTPGLAEGKDWVLVGTGTPAGTIFRAPSLFEKIMLFVRSGFRMPEAQKLWLEKFRFLAPNDELEFRSKALGVFKSRVAK